MTTTDTMTRKVDDHEDLVELRERLEAAESKFSESRAQLELALSPKSREDVEQAATRFANGEDVSAVRVDIGQLRSAAQVAERGVQICRERITARRNEISREMEAECDIELIEIYSRLNEMLAGVFDEIMRIDEHQTMRRSRGIPEAQNTGIVLQPAEIKAHCRLPLPGIARWTAFQYFAAQKQIPALAEVADDLAARFAE